MSITERIIKNSLIFYVNDDIMLAHLQKCKNLITKNKKFYNERNSDHHPRRGPDGHGQNPWQLPVPPGAGGQGPEAARPGGGVPEAD